MGVSRNRSSPILAVSDRGRFCREFLPNVFSHDLWESRISLPRPRSCRCQIGAVFFTLEFLPNVSVTGSPAYRSSPDPGGVRSGQVLLIGVSSEWSHPPDQKGFKSPFGPFPGLFAILFFLLWSFFRMFQSRFMGVPYIAPGRFC